MNSRIEFWNLKPEESSNILTKDEEDKLWLPHLIFTNTEKDDITVADEKSELIVERKAEAKYAIDCPSFEKSQFLLC